jgi:hypothetical protein
VLTFDPDMRIAALAILCASSAALADAKPPAHYAALFEKGRTWTYELAVTDFDYVERPDGTVRAVPGKPVKSRFTCTVADVAGNVATVTCDKEIDSAYSFRVDGQWVATRTGIARDEGGPVLVGVRPKVRRTRTKTDFGGYMVTAVTSPAKDTWCSVDDTTKYGAGDGAITTVCFKAGVGVASGKFDYYGGTPRIVEYKIVR